MNKQVSCIFDLETSDSKPYGQIMDLAYIFIDSSFKILSKTSCKIKLSRWQIPHPQAILVNKLSVKDHEKKADYTERQALEKFSDDIEQYLSEGYEVILSGQNIAGFDLEYLRSNRLRNALPPYNPFSRCKLLDLMYFSKKLMVCYPEFLEKLRMENGECSISLQNLMRAFQIGDGVQSHDALEDCLLTLEIFKLYKEQYGLNLFTYESYEPKKLVVKRGDVFKTFAVNVKEGKVIERMLFLHSQTKKYYLWGDLTNFDPKKGKRNLYWFSNDRQLILGNKIKFDSEENRITDPDILSHAYQATHLPDIENITTDDYFSPPVCDVELHPTKVDIRVLHSLLNCMIDSSALKWLKQDCDHYGVSDAARNAAKEFYKRNRLFYLKAAAEDMTDSEKDLVKEYASERYRTGLKWKVWDIFGDDIEQKRDIKERGDTLAEMITFAKQTLDTSEDKKQKTLMKEWLAFVEKHEINRFLE